MSFEVVPHSGIICACVLLSAGGQKWWSSFQPPPSWTYGQRERLSFPVTRARHARHLHQPAAHPVTTTTQHWFNWICVWSKSSSLKPETWPDACPTMMGNKVNCAHHCYGNSCLGDCLIKKPRKIMHSTSHEALIKSPGEHVVIEMNQQRAELRHKSKESWNISAGFDINTDII